MTDPETGESAKQQTPAAPSPVGRLRTLQLLPGLVAIGLYMIVLAVINILGVVGGQGRPVLLVFSALFIAAALGLLMLLRWAWALTLAAMVLLVALFLWKFAATHDFPYAIQGLLNLVFFLYLVRADVREKLR
jgi:signal transduction histidine kinase